MSKKLVHLVNKWDEYSLDPKEEVVPFTKEEREEILNLSQEDLGKLFALAYNESGMFWYIVNETERSEYCAYGIEEQNGAVFLEQVQESVHQSFDGPWTAYDRIVIRSYLADITWATYQVLKDRA